MWLSCGETRPRPRPSLIGLIASLTLGCGPASAALQPEAMVLAQHARPVVLSATPQAIALTNADGSPTTFDEVMRKADDGRLLVVLRGVSANRQPGAMFEISIPSGGASTGGDRRDQVVGTINFFRALPDTADNDLFESFDVTEMVRRLPAAARAAPLSVTIAPVARVDPQAGATIRRIELVKQ